MSSTEESTSVMSELKPETTDLLKSPSNYAKSSNLLTKRYETTDLGDLLAKKIKTGSTSMSESGSNQFTSISEKNSDTDSFGNTPGSRSPDADETHTMIQEDSGAESSQTMMEPVKHLLRIPPFDGEKPYTLLSDSPYTASTRSFSYDSNNIPLIFQESISHFSSDISFDLSPQKMTILESQQRVQQALEELQRRMMIDQQAKLLQELLLQVPLPQELLNIPSFVPTFSMLGEVPAKANETKNPNNEKKNANNKKVSKRDEDEQMDFIYGSIEFPFLSLSLPLNNNEEASKNFDLSLLDTNKIDSMISAKLPDSLLSLSDDNKQATVEMRESLTATRAGTQKSDTEIKTYKKKNY